MSAKVRAFLFNFLCFGALFILIRLGILYLFPELSYAVTAAFEQEGKAVLLMRWIFLKGIRQL